jgi:lysophospholipase L1-like esterase
MAPVLQWRRGPRLISCLGDSISDTAFRPGVAWPAFLPGFLQRSRVQMDGVSGADTAQVLSRCHDGGIFTYTDAPYNNPAHYARTDQVVFHIGVNDFIFQTADAAQAQANHEAVLAYLAANGYGPVALIPTLPFGGHSAWTSAMEANRVAFNTYIRGLSGTHKIIDLEPSMVDPSSPVGQPKLLPIFVGSDGLHPNARGGQHMALNVAFAL